MKVGLLFPNFCWNNPILHSSMHPPTGLAYLAALLETKGNEVKIFDHSATPKSWKQFVWPLFPDPKKYMHLNKYFPFSQYSVNTLKFARLFSKFRTFQDLSVAFLIGDIFEKKLDKNRWGT
jgi:hypothetical protein